MSNDNPTTAPNVEALCAEVAYKKVLAALHQEATDKCGGGFGEPDLNPDYQLSVSLLIREIYQILNLGDQIDALQSALRAERAARVAAEELLPACADCGKPAACYGTYEGRSGFACDECCGHGCEDGYCFALPDGYARLLEAETSEAAKKCDERNICSAARIAYEQRDATIARAERAEEEGSRLHSVYRAASVDAFAAVRRLLRLDDKENLQGACARIMSERDTAIARAEQAERELKAQQSIFASVNDCLKITEECAVRAKQGQQFRGLRLSSGARPLSHVEGLATRFADCALSEIELTAERDALRTQLAEAQEELARAVEFIDELLPYVPAYFRDKWKMDAERATFGVLPAKGDNQHEALRRACEEVGCGRQS